MKRALLTCVLMIKTIFIIVAVVSLILAISVYGNDKTTIVMAILFITSCLICLFCALAESLIKDQIRRLNANKERADQKQLDKTFYNVKPCSSGWEVGRM